MVPNCNMSQITCLKIFCCSSSGDTAEFPLLLLEMSIYKTHSNRVLKELTFQTSCLFSFFTPE